MFSDPRKNVEQLELLPGMHVADLGSGSGFYTLLLARVVGPTGRVYSVDIQKDLLAKVKTEASKEKLFNVEVIWGDVEKIGGTRLKEASMDMVIISNILFQIGNKDAFIKEAARITKPGGRICVIDWEDSFGGLGPQQSDVVTSEMAKKLFEKAGFTLDKEISAGDHHYGLIFKNTI